MNNIPRNFIYIIVSITLMILIISDITIYSYSDKDLDLKNNLTKLPKNEDDIRKLRFSYVQLDNTYLTVDRYYSPIMNEPSLAKPEKSYLIKGCVAKVLYRNQEIVHIGEEYSYWYYISIDDINSSKPCQGWVFGGFASLFSSKSEALNYSLDITKYSRKQLPKIIDKNDIIFKGLNGLGLIDGSEKPVPLYIGPFPCSTKMITTWITGAIWVHAGKIIRAPNNDDEMCTYRRVILKNRKQAWVLANNVNYVQKSYDNYQTNEAIALLAKGGIINNTIFDCSLLILHYYPEYSNYKINKQSGIFFEGASKINIDFVDWNKDRNKSIIKAKLYPGFSDFDNSFYESFYKKKCEI